MHLTHKGKTFAERAWTEIKKESEISFSKYLEGKQTNVLAHFFKFVKVVNWPSKYPDIRRALCSMIFQSQMTIYVNLKYGKMNTLIHIHSSEVY